MSPKQELNLNDAGFLKRIFPFLGRQVPGQAYEIHHPNDNSVEVVVVGDDFIHASEPTLSLLEKLIGAFRGNTISPAAHDPSASIDDLELGTRVRNTLTRGKLETVGKLRQALEEDPELNAIRQIGHKSLEVIKDKLGKN